MGEDRWLRFVKKEFAGDAENRVLKVLEGFLCTNGGFVLYGSGEAAKRQNDEWAGSDARIARESKIKDGGRRADRRGVRLRVCRICSKFGGLEIVK